MYKRTTRNAGTNFDYFTGLIMLFCLFFNRWMEFFVYFTFATRQKPLSHCSKNLMWMHNQSAIGSSWKGSPTCKRHSCVTRNYSQATENTGHHQTPLLLSNVHFFPNSVNFNAILSKQTCGGKSGGYGACQSGWDLDRLVEKGANGPSLWSLAPPVSEPLK